ncbi:unnamed protein product [Brassica napus]|uniref:(rape) hypothetical protein n=1 Tax=Brassica napus TaxID=3708 RepID=A0A816VNA4_BRANA|nr:unnamed protein product [Brassica napus]
MANDQEVMFFRAISLGPHETQICYRLIHFGSSKPTEKKKNIYWSGNSPHRFNRNCYSRIHSIRILLTFYGSKNKTVHRVAYYSNSIMSVLNDSPVPFDEDRLRFHSYEDFEAKCDLKCDLYEGYRHLESGEPRREIGNMMKSGECCSTDALRFERLGGCKIKLGECKTRF